MAGAAAAERWLRHRAEEVIGAADRPAPDLAEVLQELSDAADALGGAGVVAAETARGVVQEAVDALRLRGVEWLGPWVPELDLASLASLASPAPGAGPPVAPGSAGRPWRPAAVEPAGFLERLAWQQLALVRRRPAVEVVNGARARLAAAARALVGAGAVVDDPARLVDAFDATLAAAGLVERYGPDGAGAGAPAAWLGLVTGATGHWCLPAGGLALSEACVWSAVDDAGGAYGGAPDDPGPLLGPGTGREPPRSRPQNAEGAGLIRFDPGLPAGLGHVTVLAVDAGRALELVVRPGELPPEPAG
ncbi:MAG TPA: hypothetical protein VFO65_12675 [Acidimicrobiales bacterium]|nr:hypothetical protein [Acidimicrobiales bacterium]